MIPRAALAPPSLLRNWTNCIFEEFSNKLPTLLTPLKHLGSTAPPFIENANSWASIDPDLAPTHYDRARARYRIFEVLPLLRRQRGGSHIAGADHLPSA